MTSATMVLTGDVNLRNVDDPDVPFGQVAETLSQADLVFGNLEGCLYDDRQQIPYKPGWFHAAHSAAPALRAGGFDVVGCANNVTFGAEAIESTLAKLDEMGVAHVGAGRDRHSARTPAIVQKAGIRFGFLQYTSVFWPVGHEATETGPGVAAIKAHTAYQPHRRIPEMPGGPATVITWPDPDYLEEFRRDVRSLRRDVDVLVTSFHWGISSSDETAQYQVTLAHAAVQEGADVVIGHGPHVLQAVEVYRDTPIFYSLGNFYFGWELMSPDWTGLAAWVEIEDGAVVRVTGAPVRPNRRNQTTLRSPGDEGPALARLEELSRRFDTALEVDGAKVVVWERP